MSGKPRRECRTHDKRPGRCPRSRIRTLDTLLSRCAQRNWNPEAEDHVLRRGESRRPRSGTSALCVLVSTRCAKTSRSKNLITSALPKEGKSFVAANLAQVLVRQHGRRVLLIMVICAGRGCTARSEPTRPPDWRITCLERATNFRSSSAGPLKICFSCLAAARSHAGGIGFERPHENADAASRAPI